MLTTTRKTRFYTLILLSLLITSLTPSRGWALNGADVAIYNDTSYANGGAWQQGLIAIKDMLDSYGISHEDINADTLNSGTDLNSLYTILIFGGGWAGGYSEYINLPGQANIRRFVANGGGFFGICAGAYFSADTLVWRQDYQSAQEEYMDAYNNKLFKGVAKGPVLGIKTWTAPTQCSSDILYGAAMTRLTTEGVFTGTKSTLNILYYGGPLFVPFFSKDNDFTVLARYNVPGTPADAEPAIIYFQHGQGAVCLSGPHPEISFNNCTLSYDYTNWDFMYNILLLLGNI